MITDVTGIPLIPGNCGNECPGSWENAGFNFCCDECDYLMCCLESHDPKKCLICKDTDCPRSPSCPQAI